MDEAQWQRAYDRTRQSLIGRLHDWQDRKTWEDFYQTYWRLIYAVALKAGLKPDEASDVVQETVLTIARQQEGGRAAYDPAKGSFKNWLLGVTRWRIGDRFRKRARELEAQDFQDEDDARTGELERFADPRGVDLEREWDAEWARNLTQAALARVKGQVSPKQFQIFDCYVVKGWKTGRVMETLNVSLTQVYLAKHRVGKLVKKEIEALQSQLL